MKKNEMMIMQCYMCNFDPKQNFTNCDRYIPGDDDETSKYILKLVKNAKTSLCSKPAAYTQDSDLAKILPDNPSHFEGFCKIIAEQMTSLMHQYKAILPGCGVFAWILSEEQNLLVFFKLNYQAGLMAENGSSRWSLNQQLLPSAGKRGTEFFLINMDMQKIKVSDVTYAFPSDPDRPVNLIAEEILKISLQPSEQEMLDRIEGIMSSEIVKNRREDAEECMMAYRNSMAAEVYETGRIHMDQVADQVFGENSAAANECKEVFTCNQIPRIPIPVSKGVERKLQKKHKIMTSTGIEVLIPPELLQNESFFKYEEAGKNIKITIRDVSGKVE